jgi:C4-dicarboxylate transporter DctQ subunit
MKRFFQTLLHGVESVEMVFCLIAMTLTTLLICATVINRYLLHFEIMWLNDLALYIFVAFMFTAAAVATYKEGHISIDMLYQRIFQGRPRGKTFYKFLLVAVSIFILVVFLPVVYQFMKRAIQYPEYGTLVRWFNTSWLMIYLFIALLLVLMHLLVILGRDLRDFLRLSRKIAARGKE